MALFGKSLYKVKINFRGNEPQKEDKEKTLIEMAEEKFGNDKRLMMEIDLFLAQRRRVKQCPSKIAWGEQLKLLEKFPEEERLKQVTRSIRNDYRSIAYENNLPKKPVCAEYNVGMKKEKEENICYDRGF